MTFDELRRLNPRDIGSWPALPKLGALLLLLILLLVAGFFLDWSNQLDELKAARSKEDSLRSAFLDKKRQAINLEAYRRQLADIEQSFGAMLKQLPNRSEMEALHTVEPGYASVQFAISWTGLEAGTLRALSASGTATIRMKRSGIGWNVVRVECPGWGPW